MTAGIESYGALGVFLLMVPESACIPLPSEVTLLFSGFAVYQGSMSFLLAVLAATAGNLVGSLLAYGMGASRLPGRVPIARTVLCRWEGLLERHGTRAVFIARLLPSGGATRVERLVSLLRVMRGVWLPSRRCLQGCVPARRP